MLSRNTINKSGSYLPDAAVVLTCFLWGLNAVVTKNALGDTPDTFRAFIFNEIRISAASLLLFMAAGLAGYPLGIKRRHIPLIVGVSFFGMFFFMVTFILGISLTSASNLGVINASTPLFIILISFVTGIEHPTKRVILGIIIGFCGMLALSWKGGEIVFNPGDIFILLSCLFWAVYTVYGKKITKNYNPLVATAWIYFVTSLFQLPFFIMQLPTQYWAEISTANWANITISCIGSLFLANSLYYYSVNKIGPSRVGVYTNLTPVFTLLLAALIRDESIGIAHIVGLVVILFGIAISTSRRL
ncbi:MAG: DMT family transporter [Candidatus Latescibacterota bacterium]